MNARRLERWPLDHPALVLGCVLLILLVALSRLFDVETWRPRFDVDPSMSALLPRDGAALATFERARRLFNDDDVLFVAWIADDLFSPSRLAALKRLTRRIERLPGVVRVDSLATALDVKVDGEETTIQPFLRELPRDAAAAAQLRARALANPQFRGQLVSDDGRGMLLAVQFAAGLDTRTLLAVVARVDSASQEESGGVEHFLSGPMLVRLEISRILLHDLYRVTPFAVLSTLLVAAVAFRSLRGMLLPMLANGAAVVITLALFVGSGHALNFITVILPSIVYVVGFAYAIHVVSEFDRIYVTGADRRQAAQTAIREVFVPLALSALTTAIGFAALAMSSIDSIRSFGLFASLGTLLAWAAALTVVPAGLVLLPGRPHAEREQRAIAHLAARLARFNLAHRRALLATAIVLTLGAALAATRVEVDTDVLGNFSTASLVQRHFQRIGEIFSGPVPIRILIDAERPDAFKDPAALREVAKLGAWLEAQPEIRGVYTLADQVTMLHRALAPDAANADPIPATSRIVGHLLLGSGSDLSLFVDPSYSATLVHVRSTALSTAAVNALAARIEARLGQLPPTLRGQVTGTTYLIAQTVDALTIGQIQSLALAIGAIFLMLSLLFGSPRIGALALVPNVLPIVFYFGLLGLCGIKLNLTTSLVACPVLGIAIDDTMHFLSRFAIESRRKDGGDAGVAATLAAVLRPMTLNTLALGAGFLALTTGELRSQVEFGLLATATLLVAWLIEFTVTPGLCRNLRIRPIWDRR